MIADSNMPYEKMYQLIERDRDYSFLGDTEFSEEELEKYKDIMVK